MKKRLATIFVLVLCLFVLPFSALAKPVYDEIHTYSGTVSSLPSKGNPYNFSENTISSKITLFKQEDIDTNKTIKTTANPKGFGTISCKVEGMSVWCNYKIRVYGDRIIRSDIIVETYRRIPDSMNQYIWVDNDFFWYNVTNSKPWLEDQYSYTAISPGSFKTVLAGTFTGANAGVYVAVADSPAYYDLPAGIQALK